MATSIAFACGASVWRSFARTAAGYTIVQWAIVGPLTVLAFGATGARLQHT